MFCCLLLLSLNAGGVWLCACTHSTSSRLFSLGRECCCHVYSCLAADAMPWSQSLLV